MSLISGIELADSPHPMTIGEAPEQWIDASDDSTVTTVSIWVSSVIDKSGNGHTVDQPTSTSRPNYSNTQNGLSVFTFDGTDDFLNISSLVLPVSQTTYTVLAAFQCTASGLQSVWEQAMNPQVTNRRVCLLGNGTTINFNGEGNDYHYSNIVANTFTVCGFMRNGTTELRGYKDFETDAQDGRLGHVNAGTPNLNTLNTGNGYGTIGRKISSEYLNGRVGEILVWTSSLEDHQVNAMIRYLTNKWGI